MGANAVKILKRDAVGRVSYSAEQREEILDQFERSGLKGAAFARMTGLQYQTFAAWIQGRRHERGDYQAKRAPAGGGALARPEPEKAVRLLEVVMAKPDAVKTECLPELRVELPCGTRLLVADERQAVLAARLIQSLAACAPC